MRILFVISFFLIGIGLFSQAGLPEKKAVVDMEVIERGDDRILETSFVNPGITQLTLLRVKGPPTYDIRTDTLVIGIGERMRIRLKFNPREKGIYKDEINFFFNDLTHVLTVKSDVQYVDLSDHNPCPDFEKVDRGSNVNWQAYFKVIDRDSREILPNATIRLEGKSGEQLEFKTDKRGEVLTVVPIDFYQIHVVKEGYAKFRQENYINRRNKDFVLELMAGEQGSVVVWRPSQREKEDEPIVAVAEAEVEEFTEVEMVEEPIPEPEPVPEQVIVKGQANNFSLREFKPNNVVFLIDISTSMRQEERIDLLKEAMLDLASMLRPDDIISIVTYATSTDIVLSGKRADDHDLIDEAISELKADGMTAGEAGLKQAYRECEKYFIPGGNNHVYLATDGAFNKGLDKMRTRVKNKNDDDMHLTILAIKSSKWSDARMIDLADIGGGQHLKIEGPEDKKSLKELIRIQSKR
jgi:Ca-activated chloride channel family protein